MLSEHPASERGSVIRTGRVQGGLQPTRAFGDAVYKWTPHQAAASVNSAAPAYERCSSAVRRVSAVYKSWGERFRPQRPNTFTPPYVTAKPEVTHRKISSINGETLRFIVMATDGCELTPLPGNKSTLTICSVGPDHLGRIHPPRRLASLPPSSL